MEDSTKIKTVRYALKDLNPQEKEHKKRQWSQNPRSSEADEQESRS